MLWKLLILNTKIITKVDDYIRLVAMTAIGLLIAFLLGLSGIPFMLVVGTGIAIDVHDVAVKFIEEKPIL